MPLFSAKFHRQLFVWFTVLALISLPYSEYTLSIGVIAIAVSWVLEGRWKEKISILKSRKSVWVFLLIFFFHVIGMIYTSNLSYGLSELRLKLPLLLLPIVFSTSKSINSKEQILLLSFFILSIITASGYSTFLFFQNFSFGGANVREISPFISHIRFGLMVNIAIFSALYYFIKPPSFINPKLKWIFLGTIIWFVFFLLILQSLTAIVVLVSTILFLLFLVILRLSNPIGRFVAVVILSISVLFVFSFMAHKVDNFFTRHQVDLENLPTKTLNGNPYIHNPDRGQYENGHLVWINVCHKELELAWNLRSDFQYNGNDKMNQPISYTLIRYLASKGLSKDSLGVSKLDDIDIALVESGVTSEIFRRYRFGIYPRLYQFFWEIDQYKNFGQINGSPFIQRYVYIKAAISIIKSNFWFGVGTGDIVDEFKNHYSDNEQDLNPLYWYLSHNQYLTQWVSLGVFGFIALLVGWFIPFFRETRQKDYLCLTFFFILTLSMFNEDTFQTHVGVCLAAIFYSLLIFGKESNELLFFDNEPPSN